MVSLVKNKIKQSDSVMEKIEQQISSFGPRFCKTIMFDQGSDFAHDKILERQLGVKIYYCEPQSPGQNRIHQIKIIRLLKIKMLIHYKMSALQLAPLLYRPPKTIH